MSNKKLHTAFLMNGHVDEKLYNFLDGFDPVELKYSTEPYCVFPNSDEKVKDCYKKWIPWDIKSELIEYDSTFTVASLNKESDSSISDNLMLVYGSQRVVKSDVQIFNKTERKLISQYLGIPQLEKMFDEDYFQFECDMHIAQNYREHRNDYQRDHFIHEIRDMYSMMILLGNHGFYEAAKKILSDRSISKISLFTQKKLSEFKSNRKGVYSILEKVQKRMHSGNTLPLEIYNKYKDIDTYSENYFMKYVIYASSILSALFHDMGYPICHFLNVRNRTSEYIPTLYMYTKNEVESFDQIASLLSNSLLFTIVSRNEIRDAMKEQKPGKYDHGAYSAIAFLLQFYNSGIIFSLSEEKQCAIELAAVAIYNHTMGFKILDKKTKSNFYQPRFNQNPIAFMLRLCDDLQEWGRRYFVISSESDIPICSECLTPSIFNCPKEKNRDKILYKCGCSSNETPDYNSFRYKNFYNRKLYLVSTSEYMTSYIIDIKNDSDKKALCFHINYDYYKLLNVTRINHTYAKFRLSEINGLKKLIKNQNFKNYFDFDYIFFDYFMTANPITIKLKILEKFIVLTKFSGKTKLEENDIKNTNLESDIIKNLKFPNGIDYGKSKLKTILEGENGKSGVFDFYKKLLKEVIKLRNNYVGKDVDVADIKNTSNGWIDKYFKKTENKSFSEYYKKIMKDLISETFEQYAREIIIDKTNKEDNGKVERFDNLDKYYSQYAPNSETENALYNSIKAYCNAENDFNSYGDNLDGKSNPPYLSYFSDLYFFEEMNRVIQKEYIDEFTK